MTRAVFFDVGNTLLYPHPSVAEVCHEILVDAGHIRDLAEIDSLMPVVDAYYEDCYRQDDTFWTDDSQTNAVWVAMYSLLGRRLGLGNDAEAFAHRVYDEFGRAERWRAYDDVVPALMRLKERGQRIGIISNWDGRLSALLAGLGISEMVDTIVSSAEVGLHKPDPRIFSLACERLDVEPRESVHVGDHHYADIVGASAAGMAPVLIDRHSASIKEQAIGTLDVLEAYLGWTSN